jgi:deoxyadenosine/deoxycytidine kinase
MLISVEGNIGSGKSTFCNYLREHFSKHYNRPQNANVYFVDEPVEDWMSIKDENGSLLEHFYASPDEYSFCFQMTAYISRLANLKNVLSKCNDNDVIITERSVFSDYNVFAKMLYDTSKITSIQYQCYKTWFFHFLEEIPPVFYVYIQTDYLKCHERVLQRARQGETPITCEYLGMCGFYHQNWLSNESNILIFDGNKDKSYHSEYTDVLKQMINYKTNIPDAFNYIFLDNDEESKNEIKNIIIEYMFNKTLEQCKKRLT